MAAGFRHHPPTNARNVTQSGHKKAVIKKTQTEPTYIGEAGKATSRSRQETTTLVLVRRKREQIHCGCCCCYCCSDVLFAAISASSSSSSSLSLSSAMRFPDNTRTQDNKC